VVPWPAGALLTANACAHDGVKFVQRNCGQLLEPRRHPRAHVRGFTQGCWSPRWGICSRARRPAPRARSVEERKRRGSPSLRAISSRR